MTSGQYSFCLLLNADWLIQISEGLAVCKVSIGRIFLSKIWGAYFGEGLFLEGLIIGILRVTKKWTSARSQRKYYFRAFISEANKFSF